MHQFTDSLNRTWNVAINIANQKAVHQATNLSLLTILDEKAKPLANLLADPASLATVVYWLCKRQADEQKVDDYAFAEGLTGDTIVAMRDAFLGALTDFFPSGPQRAMLMKILEAARATEAKVAKLAETELPKLSVETIANQAVTMMSNGVFGSQRESLALTPAP